MDKRTAKREACWRVASLTRSALDGWDLEAIYGPKDARRVEEQIGVVVKELEQRGHK